MCALSPRESAASSPPPTVGRSSSSWHRISKPTTASLTSARELVQTDFRHSMPSMCERETHGMSLPVERVRPADGTDPVQHTESGRNARARRSATPPRETRYQRPPPGVRCSAGEWGNFTTLGICPTPLPFSTTSGVSRRRSICRFHEDDSSKSTVHMALGHGRLIARILPSCRSSAAAEEGDHEVTRVAVSR